MKNVLYALVGIGAWLLEPAARLVILLCAFLVVLYLFPYILVGALAFFAAAFVWAVCSRTLAWLRGGGV